MLDITKLSEADVKALEEQIAQRKNEERKGRIAARKKYEDDKSLLIDKLGKCAIFLAKNLADFKTSAFYELSNFRNVMLEYGTIRNGEDNKGSFTIKNDNFKIDVKNQIVKQFDERAQLAAAKLDKFLQTFIKKNGTKFYKLVSTAIQVDEKTGRFDPDAVSRLYSIEDEFDNPLWVDGLRLFKESYQPIGSAYYISFSQKDNNNQWKRILLDFASAHIDENDQENASNNNH